MVPAEQDRACLAAGGVGDSDPEPLPLALIADPDFVVIPASVPDCCLACEPDRHHDQQHLAERLIDDRLERTLLVGGLAADAERELDGEDPDDSVDQSARRLSAADWA